MAIKKAPKAKKAEVTSPVEAPEVEVSVSDVPAAAPRVAPRTSFDVYNSDGVFIRTYTLDIHGEDAETLAQEFAAHSGGTVK